MYEAFYGLKEKPFNLTPDPDFLYLSPGHENAFTHMEYALAENKGFALITGEVGSGKTTLINYLLKGIRQDTIVGLINTTSLTPKQFLGVICGEFEVDVAGLSKAAMLDRLLSFLMDGYAQKKRIVLIIDEAQNLPLDTLEEIRMLSNLEAAKHHLIQIILSGQPELRFKLKNPELLQFAQRVTVHCHLEGLDDEQVARYILHRIRVAGAKNEGLFTLNAVKAVARHSRGIPRIINVLCDAALVYGFADELRVIDQKVIEEVVKDKKKGGLFESPPRPGTQRPVAQAKPQTPARAVVERLTALEKGLGRLTDLIEQYRDEDIQREEAFRKRVVELLEALAKPNGDERKAAADPNGATQELVRVARIGGMDVTTVKTPKKTRKKPKWTKRIARPFRK